MEDQKWCNKCKTSKGYSQFNKNKSEKSGYQTYCRKCQSKKSDKIDPPNIIEGEIWKDVLGYEGYYQVSNLGRLKSLSRVKYGPRGSFISQEHLLRVKIEKKSGYVRVMLQRDAIRKTYNVHRLVAIAFVSNPNNLPEVNHLDKIRQNNFDWNLEWVSKSENGTHGFLGKEKKSGHWGVLRETRYNGWTVVIRIAYKTRKYIGSYKTEEEAIKACKEAMLKYGVVNKYA